MRISRKFLASVIAALSAALVITACGGDKKEEHKLDDPNPDNTKFHVGADATRFGGPAPLTIKFYSTPFNKKKGDPVYWRWRFDDGTPHSEEQNPTHTFPKPGYYQVLMEARTPTGHDAWNLIVGVWPPKLWEAGQKSATRASPTTVRAFQRQQGRRTGKRRKAQYELTKKRAEQFSQERPGT